VRTFDPRASLSVVSLDAIWFDIAKTAEEVAKAPQPKAGTSTDLRLFRLSPLEDEVAGAKDKFKSGAGLQDGDTPLFYDESFLLTLDGEPQKPFFFRLTDLLRAYDQEGRAEPPAVRVATLGSVVRSLEKGGSASKQGPPPLFVAASDAAAVVERMSGRGEPADGGGGDGSGTAQAASGDRGGSDNGDGTTFYLNVPFGGGGGGKKWFSF